VEVEVSRASVDAVAALVRFGLDPSSDVAREPLGEGVAIGPRFVLFTRPTVTGAALSRVHEALRAVVERGRPVRLPPRHRRARRAR
jgi:hypothetical protein